MLQFNTYKIKIKLILVGGKGNAASLGFMVVEILVITTHSYDVLLLLPLLLPWRLNGIG